MVGGRGGDFGEFAVESLPLELHLHVLGERTVHALLADRAETLMRNIHVNLMCSLANMSGSSVSSARPRDACRLRFLFWPPLPLTPEAKEKRGQGGGRRKEREKKAHRFRSICERFFVPFRFRLQIEREGE